MKEIIIGRKGTQPFKIVAEGVSAQHAALTIRDDGKWVLKDLDSTNGTFVRNEAFRFERIGKRVIGKNTVIRLGCDDTIRSIQFSAIQLVKDKPDDYSYEFNVLRENWDVAMKKKDAIEKKVNMLSFAPIVAYVIVVIGTLPFDVDAVMLRCFLFVPTMLAPFINKYGKKKIKELSYEMKNTFVCPNPQCSLPLSETDVKKGKCPRCNCHI